MNEKLTRSSGGLTMGLTFGGGWLDLTDCNKDSYGSHSPFSKSKDDIPAVLFTQVNAKRPNEINTSESPGSFQHVRKTDFRR